MADYGDLESIKLSPGGICPKCYRPDRISLIVSCGCGVRRDIGAAMVPDILAENIRLRELLKRVSIYLQPKSEICAIGLVKVIAAELEGKNG